jgi:zinc protease
LPPVPEPDSPGATHIHLVDKPGAVQSEIRVSQIGVPRSTPDYFPLIVMNAILGEAFGSRLFFNLREAHGFTYGVSSSFGMRRGRGPFVASAAVQTAVTDAALVEFMREMRNIREIPPTEKELRDAKGYLSGGLAVDLQSNGSVAERISEGELYGLGADHMDAYRDRILAVTSADVERVARAHVDPERMVITIVGDAQEIEAPLRKLYPVTVYDVMGEPRE